VGRSFIPFETVEVLFAAGFDGAQNGRDTGALSGPACH